MRESLDRAFAGEAHAHRTEARGHHFETVYSPVRGPDGSVIAVSIRVADVTARAKDAFLASMSHELRTPLTGILGAAPSLSPVRHPRPRQDRGRAAVVVG